MRLCFRNETAHAWHPHDLALAYQLPQRTVDGHPGHAELGYQLLLRWQSMTGGPFTILNSACDVLFYLRIQRKPRRRGRRRWR